MEPASLVLATLALIKPICDTIQSTLNNYSQYAKDADSLRLRFANARVQLESFDRVLHTPDKFAPTIRGQLIHRVDKETFLVLHGLAEELRYGLEQYVALKMDHEQSKVNTTVQNAAADEVAVRSSLALGALMLSGSSAARDDNPVTNAKLKFYSTARRLRWALLRRNTTQSVVEDFEDWTARMRNTIEAVFWSLSLKSTVEQLQALHRDEDARNVGLLQGIRLRELLATPPTNLESHVEGLYTRAFHKSGEAGAFDIGTIDQKEGLYLVEYKKGDNGATEELTSRTREQIIKLAALLRDAPSSDEGLGVLPCTSYIEDSSHDVSGLVYALPSTFTIDSMGSLRPRTLCDLLQSSSPTKISLESRIRLASSLFYTVHRLHVYGWVHKSLRADNVLLLPKLSKKGGIEYNLAEPKLLGFDWARKDNEISPQEAGLDMRRNVYRHPHRWGQPTSRFDKVHDIYALGVILLELSLGHSVLKFENEALVKDPKYHDCKVLSERLLRNARQRLGFYCGARMQGIVVGCLTGNWRGKHVAEQLPDMVMALMEIAAALESET